MHWTEIVTIILVIAIVLGISIYLFLRKKSGKSLEFCAEEKHGSDLVEAYHKKYGNKAKN